MSWCTLVAALAALFPVAFGHSQYMNSIPNGGRVQRGGARWYGVGHFDSYGGGSPNSFGAAFAAAGYQWTADLCVADSDGDGQSNGLELGDPDCVWSKDKTPSRTEDISHPGFADSTTPASEDVATTPAPTTTATAEVSTATTTATLSSTSSSTVTTATETSTATSTATTSSTSSSTVTTAAETSTATAAATTTATATMAVPSPPTETSTSTTTLTTSTSAASITPSTTIAASTTSTAPPSTSSTIVEASTSAASVANSTTVVSTTPSSTIAASTSSTAPLSTTATLVEATTSTASVADSTTVASATASTTSAASTTSTAPPSTSSTSVAASTSAASVANSTTAASASTTEVSVPPVDGSQPSAENSTTAEPDDGLRTLCEFDNEPWAEGYYWDATCEMGVLGCNADGKHIQCRLCGAGAFAEIPCPPSSCQFMNEPFVPYYWDPSCAMGKLGCWADGIHSQCRFCGDHPYTSIECPSTVGGQQGQRGSDGANSSHGTQCSFANEPAMPYFWDADCSLGKLGCLADGIHEQCRFCAQRPFEEIPCPTEVAPPANRCAFPEGKEPSELYYWDAACTMGMLGCWADDIHAECRFCGGNTFRNVSCPTVRMTGAAAEVEGQSSAQSAAASRVGSGTARPGAALDTRAPEEELDLSRAARLTSPLSCMAAVLLVMMTRP